MTRFDIVPGCIGIVQTVNSQQSTVNPTTAFILSVVEGLFLGAVNNHLTV